MKKTTSAVIAFSFLFVLAAGLQIISFVAANPLPPPVIHVESPSNNQIYPSGEVWLNFTRLPDTDYVTSITYRLDGQAEVIANERTLLSGLSAGSHSLALYAKMSAEINDYGFLITKIYFSVNYSPAWITFIAIFSAVLVVGLLTLFVTRRRLVAELKTKKTAVFWVGLVFLLLGAFFLGLLVKDTVNNYLFPVYRSSLAVNLYPGLIFSLCFLTFSIFLIGVGLASMRIGLKKEPPPKGAKSNLTQEREEEK